MALTVIGGANFFGRYLIRALAGQYSEIRLADMYPYRKAVYGLQEEIGDKIVKHPLHYSLNLRQCIEGSKDVIVVTHDYFKLAFGKNFYLEKAAGYAKNAGIKNFTWVGPHELDQLNGLDGDPEKLIQETISKVRLLIPEFSVLRTNLLFGENCTSLAIHKALESLSTSQTLLTANGGKSKFQPVHEADALKAFKELKPGETVELAGPEVLSWKEIVEVLSKYANVTTPSHDGFGQQLAATIGSYDCVGDLFYPSHYTQLYKLLSKDLLPTPTKVGTTKLSDVYGPAKFKGIPALNWHRVILD